MSEQQINTMASKLVEFQGHFSGMSTKDRQWVIQNTTEAIGLFAEAVKNRVVETAKKILSLVTTVKVSAVDRFIVAEKFRIGETDGVKIGWVGQNFKDIFLGKTEEDVPEATLRIHQLEQASLDAPITGELGDTAKTFLANLWELLRRQGHGQEGKLLVNGYANIFYIRDANNGLWAVNASWHADNGYWDVEADSVTDPNGWRAGSQVVSR
ncbi:MAG: hypothetical protein PHV99_02070 [Candidatus Pacebacteria bacterium]|nr:hypothetical protein [Candidatus Paceibacterota bacterium]